MEVVYNVLQGEKDISRFSEVLTAFKLLEDDYLGGSGSRGYGRIEFKNLRIALKTKKDYESDNRSHTIFEGEMTDKIFESVKSKIMNKTDL